jgi:hypothetical protein
LKASAPPGSDSVEAGRRPSWAEFNGRELNVYIDEPTVYGAAIRYGWVIFVLAAALGVYLLLRALQQRTRR